MVQYEAVKSDTPSPIKVLKRGPYELEARIRAQHKSFFFLIAGSALIFFLLLFGWIFLIVTFDSLFLGTLIVVGAVGGLVYWIRYKNLFHIHLRVTPDAVTINGKNYNPQLWERFVSDFSGEIKNKQGVNISKFSDLDFIYGGNRHKTSHALPVNTGIVDTNDAPAEVINWLNEAVARVIGSDQTEPDHAQTSGYRAQTF